MRVINPVKVIAIGTTLSSFAILSLPSPSSAASLSFSGRFTADDDVSLFNFDIANQSRVTLQSFSYGGGTLDDGTAVAAGGFDPVLTLFSSNGNFLDLNDDSGFGQPDPVTGAAYDSGLSSILDPGRYTVAITQFANIFNST
ncbi:MAG: DVUA0089 family protein, partial [Thermosynechococcaceae cyanobacterium]